MKNYLLITLGHNSSAIFVDNSSEKQEIIGYEQERLSRLKADSQFPIDAINEIEHNVGYAKMLGCTILISHWFNTKSSRFCKYYTEKDEEKLNSYQPERIEFVNNGFTHHDAHAFSAHAFFKYNCPEDKLTSAPHHTLVVDGFGNNEEVLSLYITTNKNEQPKLIHRVYGYHFSLGLFYQYATAFVGMNENQDEYKFLGYEAHIDNELTTKQIDCIDHFIERGVDYFLTTWMNDTKQNEHLPVNTVIDFEALNAVRTFWYEKFKEVCDAIDLTDTTSFKARCAIAYLIQQICEIAISQFIKEFGVHNLTVVGGTFYNVKLNNKLLNTIDGLFCAMPLAGDQGAAIGMYEAEPKEDAPAFKFYTLAWGKRRFYNFEKYASEEKGVYYHVIHKTAFGILYEVAKYIAQHIADGRLVDVVFGNMEFGPRALGNTTTLFLPTTANTAHNNRMNHRNEVMPCAPICTGANARKLFDDRELERVIGSDKFMICTHDYAKAYSKQYGGVMHKKTLEPNTYTGRPQIVRKNTFMDMILNNVEYITDAKCLVNTSFNVHGNPIVFDTKDIIDNFNFQCEHAEDEKHRPVLFVINIV